MAKNKIAIKYDKICSDFFWFSMRGAIERAHSNALSRKCSLSIAPRTETNANSLQILPYFFYNFFIFSHWPLKFDIIKFNTCLYRFLLKKF